MLLFKFEKHIVELGKKCEFHQESEKQLRTQLAMYTEKYEEFQTTLKKSNEVFESFRSEMDKVFILFISISARSITKLFSFLYQR